MYIRGVSFVLPERVETNEDLVKDFGTWTPEKIFKKTGVRHRYISDPTKPISYYLAMAGDKFFEEHPDIPRESIDMLVTCNETRDYIVPATACIVHEKLGLRKTCGAIDYDLGCSGYVYGLAVCKGFIATGIARRVLFLTGEVITRYINKRDKSVRPIFGDGFSATLLEASEKDYVDCFDLGTDGSGARDIIIEAGETAMPLSPETSIEETNRFGNVRSKQDLFMDGRKVLDFSMEVVKPSVDRVLAAGGLKKEDLDLVLFHQASLLLLQHVCDELEFDPEKFVYDLEETGNTASSTIPIALRHLHDRGVLKSGMKILLSGFGVGLSWATCLLEWKENLK